MLIIVGLFLLVALWLTHITHEHRQNKLKNRIFENKQKLYIKQLESKLQELITLKNQLYGKGKTKETTKTGNTGEQS